jgi:hypothetical protein
MFVCGLTWLIFRHLFILEIEYWWFKTVIDSTLQRRSQTKWETGVLHLLKAKLVVCKDARRPLSWPAIHIERRVPSPTTVNVFLTLTVTPESRLFLENLIVAQLTNTSPPLLWFITMFTRTRHCTVFWISWIQSAPSHHILLVVDDSSTTF